MKFSGMQPMRLDETCIREMLGSSLGHNTSIQVDILRGIPQSQESNAGMSPLRSKFFTIETSCHPKVYSFDTDNVVRQPSRQATNLGHVVWYKISKESAVSILRIDEQYSL